jgi:hypothetical protein
MNFENMPSSRLSTATSCRRRNHRGVRRPVCAFQEGKVALSFFEAWTRLDRIKKARIGPVLASSGFAGLHRGRWAVRPPQEATSGLALRLSPALERRVVLLVCEASEAYPKVAGALRRRWRCTAKGMVRVLRAVVAQRERCRLEPQGSIQSSPLSASHRRSAYLPFHACPAPLLPTSPPNQTPSGRRPTRPRSHRILSRLGDLDYRTQGRR